MRLCDPISRLHWQIEKEGEGRGLSIPYPINFWLKYLVVYIPIILKLDIPESLFQISPVPFIFSSSIPYSYNFYPKYPVFQ